MVFSFKPRKTKIQDAKAFEEAIVAIVKDLTSTALREMVAISRVDGQFHRLYGKPITAVLKELEVGKSFPQFLAECKQLRVRKKDLVWQFKVLEQEVSICPPLSRFCWSNDSRHSYAELDSVLQRRFLLEPLPQFGAGRRLSELR